MVDFCDRFSLNANESSPTSLDVLKLNEQPRIISLFTSECSEVKTHFVDTGGFRGYVQCNARTEGKCLLCNISQKLETRIVLPVYDVETDSIMAMLISSTVSPSSLGPQLRLEMERGELDKRYLMVSRRFDKYTVRSAPISDGAETGEATIAGFLEQIKDGRNSLDGVIARLPNLDLFDIPQIERKATALGLRKQDYEPASAVSTDG
tara:strand:+ start:888 stop:1508 length:621 start_codon:yes stop_codon:yes gene_type:complete